MTCLRSSCIDHGQTKCVKRGGYLQVYADGKRQLAHRMAYCVANALDIVDIKGVVVRHTCDNPRCINPAHLMLGTQIDNIQDMLDRNRHTHKLKPQDIKYIREHYKPYCKQFSGAALGRKFNTSQQHISDIVNGKKCIRNGGDAVWLNH